MESVSHANEKRNTRVRNSNKLFKTFISQKRKSQAAHTSSRVGEERVDRDRQAGGSFTAGSSEGSDLERATSMVHRAAAQPPVVAEG